MTNVLPKLTEIKQGKLWALAIFCFLYFRLADNKFVIQSSRTSMIFVAKNILLRCMGANHCLVRHTKQNITRKRSNLCSNEQVVCRDVFVTSQVGVSSNRSRRILKGESRRHAVTKKSEFTLWHSGACVLQEVTSSSDNYIIYITRLIVSYCELQWSKTKVPYNHCNLWQNCQHNHFFHWSFSKTVLRTYKSLAFEVNYARSWFFDFLTG